ncbi:cytochrome c oxidase subunit 2 [Constrictibacter sp. MBR-5]|uniref:cytochrome c oxidase subunit II n=1 Tax=Constrictibacter sp. MBR-5 TaxID=3156467 RepID=UPI003399DD4C
MTIPTTIRNRVLGAAAPATSPRRALAALSPVAAMAAGCTSGPMSALDPAGPAAAAVADVWWAMFWGSAVILLAVTALALYAACRRPEARMKVSPRLLVIGGGIVFPGTVLVALLGYGLHAGHAQLPLPTTEPVFRVDVTANRWTWDIVYRDAEGGPVRSENLLYLPVDRPVDVYLTTTDVIHAFWVPRLAGKIDAIPGVTNVLRLRASRPGTFRGQCAEFCGWGHPDMVLLVEAHEAADLMQRLAALPPAEVRR